MNIWGFIGASLLVLVFLLNNFNIITESTFIYQLSNAIGSLILSIVSLKDRAYHFAFVNIIWFLASLIGIIQLNICW